MAQGRELERLFITLLADDQQLFRQLEGIQRRTREVAEDFGRAFEQGASRSFEQTGARVEASARRQKQAIDPIKQSLEAVKNETASLRNTTEAGLTSTDDAIRRFTELRDESLRLAQGLDVTSKEYRGFTQAAAQAGRSIATLQGETTKLGFSANNAVGVSAALRANIGLLGPAGTSAARGLGLVQGAFTSFAATGPGLTGQLDGIIRGFTRLGNILPLLAAGATIAAAAGLRRLGDAAAKVADEIDKGAQQAGLSVETYQELRFAFEQNGVSATRFDTALQNLNRRLGQAADGNASYARSFANLGVAIRDANGNVRDTEQVFEDVFAAIARLPSASEQAAAAAGVFGDRVGASLLPALNQGAEGFDALRQAAREAGLILSGDAIISLVDYKDTVDALNRQFEVARTEIVAGFIPVLTNVLVPLLQNTVVPLFQRAARAVSEFTASFLDQSAAGAAFRADIAASIVTVQAIGQALINLGRVSVGLVQVLTAPFAALGSVIGTLSVSLDAFLDVYRRALRGDFSGFTQRPIDVLFPGDSIERAVQAAVQQAQAGLDNLVSGGEGFFGAFDFDGNTRRLNEWLDGVVSDIERGSTRFGAAGEDAGNEYASGLERALSGVRIDPPPVGSLAAFREEASEARRAFERAVTDEARRAALERIGIAEAEIAAITAVFAQADPLAPARLWAARLGAELEFGLKNAGEVFDLIFPRIEELRAEAAVALEEFGFDSAEFQEITGKIAALVPLLERVNRTARDITVEPTIEVSGLAIPIPEIAVDVLDRPLREVAFRIAQLRAEAGEGFQQIANDYSTLTASIRLGAAAQTSAINASSEATRIFADTVQALLDVAGRESPFPEGFADFFTLDDLPEIDLSALAPVGLLEQALRERADAIRAQQAAITRDQLVAANERVRIAEEEIRRLRELGTPFTADGPFGPQPLTIPEFELAPGQAEAIAAALARQVEIVDAYESALARLSALTGDVPSEFEQLRAAFEAAADAAVITREEFEELIATLERLENVSLRDAGLRNLIDGIEIGTAISDSIGDALSSLRIGDIPGALSGLTGLGAAIGTAIGGPAVGALISGIGGFLQSLGRLFGFGSTAVPESLERTRAPGAAARGAPSVQLTFQQFNTAQFESLGDSRAQQFVDDIAARTLEVLERVVLPRLGALEERLA